MAIEWTEDLSVGYEFIDQQHKELFRAVNELTEAMWDGRGREQAERLMNFLADYVVEHFGAEERLMVHHGYPNYPAHKVLHEKFVEEFSKFKHDFDAGACSSDFCVNVLDQTCDWLRNHIRKTDKELGSFLRTT